MSRLDRVVFDLDTIPPSAPSGVSATALSQTVIRTTWSASSDTGGSGLAGYRVYRSATQTGSYSLLQTLSTASLSYDDTSLASNQTFWYKVAAFDGAGNESPVANSAAVSATTQGPSLAWSTIAQQELSVGSPYSLNLDSLCTGEVAIDQISGSLPTGISYNPATRVISGTPSVVQSTSATFRASDTNQLSDWLTRINDPGVVWYHNFENAAEVTNFLWAGGVAGDKNQTVSKVRHVPGAGFANGGALECYREGTVTAGGWYRMFSPLNAASNGRGVADPGANGTIAREAFTPTQGGQQIDQWRKGWYGHTDHWGGSRGSGGGFQFDGDTFYLQFRGKMSASRFNASYPDGKFMFLSHTGNGITQTTPNHEIVFKSEPDGFMRWYTNFGNDTNSVIKATQGSPGSPAPAGDGSTQPGGARAATCVYPNENRNACYAFNADEWITFLWKIVPGHDGNRGYPGIGSTAQERADSPNMVGNPNNDTQMTLWAARQGETTYTKIYEKLDLVMCFNDQASWPMGWNCIIPSCFMNSSPISGSWSHFYTQFIFSKNPIPCPQA